MYEPTGPGANEELQKKMMGIQNNETPWSSREEYHHPFPNPQTVQQNKDTNSVNFQLVAGLTVNKLL